MGSEVMEIIGNSIFEVDGMLKKEEIRQLLSKDNAKKTQVVLDILDLTELFKDNNELKIIGNTSISPHLRSIVNSTASGLKHANEDIIKKNI
ncbi:uncharacterized protein BX663DRAFT_73376 [Cokeromyces recurvatus]|uniref:uncharacterized protein n=1 Tax=Cokeromyces recurvatus TaxID=90255 RepID=UPI00221F527C|nr:uncharacterized protein BX663DRAFT_73376 [Cokeromyces recurvatus]KAI7902356.1 hypothetical protein BX663DRAFT_73376 [Cokeromyces recurvatus]